MNPPASSDWSDLLQTLTDRFSSLTDQALDNLESLLDSGRRLMNCSEAGLLVPHEDGRHLRFLVSVNSRPDLAEVVKQVLVPTDQSIAGCVYSTGQMIAVANPDDFYAGVDQQTGLTTNIYLAAPIVSQEDVLGVATFVNRPAGREQEPFGRQEIEHSGLVSELAAAGLRYYYRMQLQERLLKSDLAATAARFGADASSAMFEDDLSAAVDASSPLARAIVALERLSPREQGLAADLLAVLASHPDATHVGGAPAL